MLSSGQLLSGFIFEINLEKEVPELLSWTMENHSLRLFHMTMHSDFWRADSVFACCSSRSINGYFNSQKCSKWIKNCIYSWVIMTIMKWPQLEEDESFFISTELYLLSNHYRFSRDYNNNQ